MSRLRARLNRGSAIDAGFTLVELIVAASLFMLLNVFTFSAVVTHAKVTEHTRDATDVNQEARLLMSRVSRELREASSGSSAANPGVYGVTPVYATFSAAADSSLTFEVDFNGNGAIEPNASDPEVITYQYDRSAERLLVQAGGLTTPVLAANVTGFKLSFTSRLSQYDGTINGVRDGIVTWEEIDADPARVRGDGDKRLDLELQFVDSVTVDMTLFKGARRQTYRTQVDLRNRPY